MATENKDWAVICVQRAVRKLEPIAIPTQCPECSSRNIFCGSGSMKCKSCGHIEDFIHKEQTLHLEGPAFSELNDLLIEHGGERKLASNE
jgi:hypothetical protein